MWIGSNAKDLEQNAGRWRRRDQNRLEAIGRLRLIRERQDCGVAPDDGQQYKWRRTGLVGVSRLRRVITVRVANRTLMVIAHIAMRIRQRGRNNWAGRNRLLHCCASVCRDPQLTEDQGNDYHYSGNRTVSLAAHHFRSK